MTTDWIRVGALLAVPAGLFVGCGGTVVGYDPGDDGGTEPSFVSPEAPRTAPDTTDPDVSGRSGVGAGAAASSGAGGVSEPRPAAADTCPDGATRVCVCAGGMRGERTCRNGVWQPCRCGEGASCGNGRLEGGEMCDGDNLGGETCASVTMSALPAGQLFCSAECAFDTTRCRGRPVGVGGAGGTVGVGGYGGYPGVPYGYAGGPVYYGGAPGYYYPPPGYYYGAGGVAYY